MSDESNLLSWSKIRGLDPTRMDAFLEPAKLLRSQQRFEEADIVLTDAIHNFPFAAEPLIEFALVSHAAGRWDEALDRWERVRRRFPHPVGYLYAGKTLIAAKRLDQADSILTEAQKLFPDNRDVASDYAWIAVHNGNWEEALRRFRDATVQFCDYVPFHVALAYCCRKLRRLDEANMLLADPVARLPADISLLTEWVQIALEKTDWAAALQRSVLLSTHFPDKPDGYVFAVASLTNMGHYEEAEQHAYSALVRFPDNPDLLHEYSAISVKRGRMDEAIQRYRVFREQYPADPRAYTEAAELLAAQSKLDEADDLLRKGIENLPKEPRLFLQQIELDMTPKGGKLRDLSKALVGAEKLTTQFPDFEAGHVAYLSVLLSAKQADRAEAVASHLMTRFPQSADIAMSHARAAAARGASAIAEDRFVQIVEAFSENPGGYIGLSQVFCDNGKFDLAEEVMGRAMVRFPDFGPLVIEYAQVATRRGDWVLALARWTEAQRILPSNLQVTTMIFEARMRLAELDQADAAAIKVESTAAPMTGNKDVRSISTQEVPPQITDRELVMQFESLGGALLGCEFGIFQRYLGAEPLGLLRWTEIRPDELTKALTERFAGVGLPENTGSSTRLTEKGLEYITSDRNYYMNMHTFVYEMSIPRDDAIIKFCKRLQYLRRKLLEDLEESNKIFVYKISTHDVSDASIKDIHRAMQNIGDNTLLFVKRASDNKPDGLVEELETNLFIGYIDRFAINKKGVDEGVPVDAWLRICRSAHRLWKGSNKSVSYPPILQ